MKKKLLIYLFIIIFSTAFSIAIITNLYTTKAFNEILDNYEKLVLKKLEEKINIFYKILYLFEIDMKEISKNALMSISKEIGNKDINEITNEELKNLKKKYKIDDIYIINRDGIIVKTSDRIDLGFNIFSVGEEFKENLVKLFGSGKMFFERVDPSAQTGKFKFYAYYGIKNKDYLLETSINLKEYIEKRYSVNYEKYIINNFFNFKEEKSNYIVSLDIFYRSKRKIWSIINKGKYSFKSDDFFEILKSGKIIKIKKGDKIELWKRVMAGEGDFQWSTGKYLKAVFDFSPIYKYERKVIIFSIVSFIITFIIFYFIALIIIDKSFLQRLLIINERIKKIAKGDYQTKIKIKGNDELSEIAKSINKMAADIESAMNQLKDNTKILEKKVFERTKELEFKNHSLTKLSKKLEQMASTDFLTGLLNRRAILKKIQEEKIRFKRAKKPFVLILIDIDNFKNINDVYGHNVGDDVLKKFAQTLKASIREQDFVARWGGEEFLLFLPETNLKGGEILAEKIREIISTTDFPINKNIKIKITITAGVSAYNDIGKEEDEILKEIDIALYKGKREGKNIVVVFEGD